jgi:hypothetical protein
MSSRRCDTKGDQMCLTSNVVNVTDPGDLVGMKRLSRRAGQIILAGARPCAAPSERAICAGASTENLRNRDALTLLAGRVRRWLCSTSGITVALEVNTAGDELKVTNAGRTVVYAPTELTDADLCA